MAARDILRNYWPAIAIAVTAAAIACAAVVVLRSMPPRKIVMATGPEGGAYSEVGKLYRAALGDDVEVRLVQTAGSPENLAMLLDPHSGVSVALIQGGTVGAKDTSALESLGTLFYEPLWWFHRSENPRCRGRRSAGPEDIDWGRRQRDAGAGVPTDQAYRD